MTTTITRVATRATRTNSCTPTPNNIGAVEGYTFFFSCIARRNDIRLASRTHSDSIRPSFCSSFDTRHYSLPFWFTPMIVQVVVAVCYMCLYMLFVKVS